MQSSDGLRSYWTYVPPEPRALVVALHPLNWTAPDFASYTRFDVEAEANGFEVIYPSGLHKAWNAGYCCPAFDPASVDDVGFISGLIKSSAQPSWKVFMLGFSNGAMMAYRMACALPHVIAAIGVVGSDAEMCSPPPPLPAILQFQGTDDTLTGNRLWTENDGHWLRVEGTGTAWWSGLGADVKLVSVRGGRHDWYRHNPDASAEFAKFFRARM